jgi:hypothetical protein
VLTVLGSDGVSVAASSRELWADGNIASGDVKGACWGEMCTRDYENRIREAG